jgi:hypothetical protein
MERSHGGRPTKLAMPQMLAGSAINPIGLGGSSDTVARSTRVIAVTASGPRS